MDPERLKKRRAEKQLVSTTDYCVKTMEECMDTYLQSIEKVKGFGDLSEKMGHVGLHHTIGLADMMICLEKLALAKRPYERNLFGRLLAMHLCEFLDDMNILIGTLILPELDNAFLEEFIPVFKSVSREYGLIRKEHGTYLRSVRNNAAAHRTKDVPLLADMARSIDTDRLQKIALEVAVISTKLNTSSLPMTQKMIRSSEFIAQVLNMHLSGMSIDQIRNKLEAA